MPQPRLSPHSSSGPSARRNHHPFDAESHHLVEEPANTHGIRIKVAPEVLRQGGFIAGAESVILRFASTNPDLNKQGQVDAARSIDQAREFFNKLPGNAKTAYTAVTPTDTKTHQHVLLCGLETDQNSSMGIPSASAVIYDGDDAAMVKTQLVKAGYRLAKLLDAI